MFKPFASKYIDGFSTNATRERGDLHGVTVEIRGETCPSGLTIAHAVAGGRVIAKVVSPSVSLSEALATVKRTASDRLRTR